MKFICEPLGLDPVSMTYTSSGLYTWSDYLFAPGIDEPRARAVGPNDISYFSVDGLGSVVLLTNESDGSVKNKYDYKAWGESSVSVVSAHQPFVFTGRELAVPQLPAGQPYYYRARYYSPDIGRFLSEDPLGYSEGPNLYVYARNTPALLGDPFGLAACDKQKELKRFKDAYDRWFEQPKLGLGQKNTWWGPFGNTAYICTLGNKGSSCTGWAVGLLKALQPLNNDCCRAVEIQRWFPVPHTKVGIECRCDTNSSEWKTIDTFDPFWRIF